MFRWLLDRLLTPDDLVIRDFKERLAIDEAQKLEFEQGLAKRQVLKGVAYHKPEHQSLTEVTMVSGGAIKSDTAVRPNIDAYYWQAPLTKQDGEQ